MDAGAAVAVAITVTVPVALIYWVICLCKKCRASREYKEWKDKVKSVKARIETEAMYGAPEGAVPPVPREASDCVGEVRPVYFVGANESKVISFPLTYHLSFTPRETGGWTVEGYVRDVDEDDPRILNSGGLLFCDSYRTEEYLIEDGIITASGHCFWVEKSRRIKTRCRSFYSNFNRFRCNQGENKCMGPAHIHLPDAVRPVTAGTGHGPVIVVVENPQVPLRPGPGDVQETVPPYKSLPPTYSSNSLDENAEPPSYPPPVNVQALPSPPGFVSEDEGEQLDGGGESKRLLALPGKPRSESRRSSRSGTSRRGSRRGSADSRMSDDAGSFAELSLTDAEGEVAGAGGAAGSVKKKKKRKKRKSSVSAEINPPPHV
uniref:Uncharacterized protein n=1 Tax=Chromera velia CCMP2878 TaxID=1169474 RepID=A0A0G4HHA1_9ALVE|eukprot:Cvel_6861.t1-p1 / transcript=Cvel_6861.t1 / gene=Cvel_6861 / organism=Chromera_velia_CCMP2878 / gene_product=hypothetical protein / transcript_product=hypothetical protein / location=Cvel_scaffold346:79939-83333(-) / protein_length=375 / sequence_SO=supercontig / SO=protein_coding / is_pseudo=false